VIVNYFHINDGYGSTQPLLPAVSALLYATHSLLAFVLVLHHIHSVIFLKPTVSIRPSVPPSSSHKCLRFGLLDDTALKIDMGMGIAVIPR